MNTNVETGQMEVHVGDAVVYHESDGSPFNSVVTAVFDQRPHGGVGVLVNVVYVSGDKDRQDSYGRQIIRATSVQHKNQSGVHGNYWRFPDEPPNAIVEPSET